jgi:hypothetical protein
MQGQAARHNMAGLTPAATHADPLALYLYAALSAGVCRRRMHTRLTAGLGLRVGQMQYCFTRTGSALKPLRKLFGIRDWRAHASPAIST